MTAIRLHHPSRQLRGTVSLDGSKSISNRALIVLSLTQADPAAWLTRLSTSKDTRTLQQLLAQPDGVYNAGDAGTTFRFLAAYLATQPGEKTLTGSARMRERPCGPLVDALRELGADIQYLGKEGFPPIRIGSLRPGAHAHIRVPAHVSSQFLSALLMIGPCLPQGLTLVPDGPLVSRPYLEMTMELMGYFGAQVGWEGESIRVEPGAYHARALQVEADWSGASYWYALAALADKADLRLEGLFEESWQGDAVVAHMMRIFGVETIYEQGAVRLLKNGTSQVPPFRQDFLNCPDIAQTLGVVCAGAGIPAIFSGLETLSIKETDRTAALQTELEKVGVSFTPAEDNTWALHGKAAWTSVPRFATYGDHRMAMSFAALGMLGEVEIENPEVVSKSYPKFWEDLQRVGFAVEGF